MKLLSISRNYFPEIGGIQIVAKEINKCFDSIALTYNYTNEKIYKVDNIEGTIVYRVPIFFEKGSVRISLNYRKALDKLSKDVDMILYHFASGQPELDIFINGKIQNKPNICFYHMDIAGRGTFGNLYNHIIVKTFLKNMDKIIVTSPNIIKTSPVLRDFKDKIEVVPLFVDTNHFYPRKDNVRNKFINNDEKLILYVGRFGRYKGLEYLIESLRFLPENYKLLLVGKGKKEKELKDLVKKYNFNNRVIFLNHVKYQDLPFYYSAADVFVLPSIDRGEAFGLVALEAMACGIPVITTELGTGTTYHNINGETGIHVPPKNSKEIANAVNTIVSQDWKNKKNDIIINRAKDFDIKVFQRKIKKILEV
ncbi:hypothetical protein LN42_06685 [Marinitoga sp. 1137]|uniref:glycosyltransferase n=1 Tax=Marinitoga sp. 1137 TaxID=1545835 RepID=UPI00095084A5|nr:glycosyltransferase [Marinitoga sp. 1137]APT76100.1 hypothetical protein LN42_06685 [Marinitoga sp. 1137]